MGLVGLFFCLEKLQESMGDMELWRKSNRVLGIMVGLEKECGIMGKDIWINKRMDKK